MRKTEQITTTIPTEQLRWLYRRRIETSRSIASLLREAVTLLIERYEGQREQFRR